MNRFFEVYIQRFLLPLIFICGFCPVLSADDTALRPMSPVEFVDMPRLSDPVLSPDGKHIIYLKSQTDWTSNKSFKRYVLKDVKTGKSRSVFKTKKKTESFSAPIWSPDSAGFISLLRRDKTSKSKNAKSSGQPKRQAFYYALKTKKLSQLTHHSESIGNIQWAPNGSGFYFTADRPYSSGYAKSLKKGFSIKPYEQSQPDEVWFFDIKSRESRKLISGDFYVRGYNVSPDGGAIIYMRADGPTGDDRHQGELWSYDVATAVSAQLTQNRYAEARFEFAPGNQTFAYIATVNAQGDPYYEDNLFIQTVGNDPSNLALSNLALPNHAMEIVDIQWGDNPNTIFILGNTGLRTQIYKYDRLTESLTPVTQGDHEIFDWSFNPQNQTHSYLVRNAKTPGDVFVKENNSTAKQISDTYENWPEIYKLPKQEAYRWTGKGGVEIEGLLVYPVDYRPGAAFPLVTISHGGPRSSSQFGSWNTSRAVPVLAGQGYGVLLPNHRGGVGYGDAFVRDMVGGYFNNAHTDVMDGVDALIKDGLADPERLLKQGWSAGGHMTNKLITFTDRFKAASSGAGAGDWVSMYGESDIRHNRTPWFGGAPWEKDAPLDVYSKNSPLKDTWKVKTPTLFWNGANDVRVPPTQAILMYRGVKAAGVNTRLYLAPGQPHGFSKPGFKLFKINTELAWYAQHIGRPAPSPDLPVMDRN